MRVEHTLIILRKLVCLVQQSYQIMCIHICNCICMWLFIYIYIYIQTQPLSFSFIYPLIYWHFQLSVVGNLVEKGWYQIFLPVGMYLWSGMKRRGRLFYLPSDLSSGIKFVIKQAEKNDFSCVSSHFPQYLFGLVLNTDYFHIIAMLKSLSHTHTHTHT